MNPRATHDIIGQALLDFFHQNDPEDIVVESPDFDDDILPVSHLFRTFKQMPELEQLALNLCTGKVLDIGCGSGSHSLILQRDRRLNVVAIDRAPGAIEVCKRRGLLHAFCTDYRHFRQGGFDTVLLLMNGIGIAGQVSHLSEFFEKLKTFLAPGGQVLIDSSDLTYLFEDVPDSGYNAELTYRMHYKGRKSAWFPWLYLDYERLQITAQQHGFVCQHLFSGPHYEFLARLSLKN